MFSIYRVFIFLISSQLLIITMGYVIKNQDIEDCVFMECDNNGVLDALTCECRCSDQFHGYFCEHEYKDSKWPNEEFGLPMSAFDCPETKNESWRESHVILEHKGGQKEHHMWKPRWNRRNTTFSTLDPHIKGPFYKDKIQLNFCIKDKVTDVNGTRWSPGNYCIYRAGAVCPKEFAEGSVEIADYNVIEVTEEHVISSDDTITLYFCCRNDGTDEDILILPTNVPFLLHKTNDSNSCQPVKNMEVKEEVFYFVDVNDAWTFNGVIPEVVLTENKKGLVYCYYRKIEMEEFSESGENFDGEKYEGTIQEFELYDNEMAAYINWFSTYPWTQRPMFIRKWLQVALTEWIIVERVYIKDFFYDKEDGYPYYNPIHVSKHPWDFTGYGAILCEEGRRKFKRSMDGCGFLFDVNRCRKYLYCVRPVVGQFITMTYPQTTEQFDRFSFDVLTEKDYQCGKRLGMLTGEIQDFQITASSDMGDFSYGKREDGRMSADQPGWCSSDQDKSPYFEVDLITPYEINGVLLQGWEEKKMGFKQFKISFGIQNGTQHWYSVQPGKEKVFEVDDYVNVKVVRRFIFHRSMFARFIRIIPIPQMPQVCLKLELLGCLKRSRLTRDLSCKAQGSIGFGWEVSRNRKLAWPDYSTDKTFQVSEESECRDHCEKTKCSSYEVDLKTGSCSLHSIQRHDRHLFGYWLVAVNSKHYYGQKLCYYNKTIQSNLCGGFITEETILESPGYPFYYGEDVMCRWTIRFEAGTSVAVKFLDVWLPANTEDKTKMTQFYFTLNKLPPPKDTIVISNVTHGKQWGVDYTSYWSIFTVRAHDEEPYIRSLGDNAVHSIFYSSTNEIAVTLRGYLRLAFAYSRGFRLQIIKTNIPGCGIKLKQTGTNHCYTKEGIISMPFTYEYSSSVSWIIHAKNNSYIVLNFVSVTLESRATNCDSVSIEVKDYLADGREKSLGKFCKAKRPLRTYKSSWKTLSIHITHNEGTTNKVVDARPGFLVRYYSVERGSVTYAQQNDKVCPENWYHHNESCYNIFRHISSLTWFQAEELCKVHKGHLVGMESMDEIILIHELMNWVWKETTAFIGLRKVSGNMKFHDFLWSDSNTLTNAAWGISEDVKQPNGSSFERCTVTYKTNVNSPYDWQDVPCGITDVNNYICETPVFNQTKDELGLIRSISHDYNAGRNITFLFNCLNGEFILQAFVCDGLPDCSDHTDEANCTMEDGQCGDKYFQCKSGQCIHISLYCDFFADCDDQSDENNCEKPPCMEDEWRCDSGQCISLGERCDDKLDCFDGSDEMSCESVSNCGANTFRCYDDRCIPDTRVNDGITDCFLEKEDEVKSTKRVSFSCYTLYREGVRENGLYFVSLGEEEAVEVECKFDGGIVTTLIHHSAEDIEYTSVTLAAFMSSVGGNAREIAYQIPWKQINTLNSISDCRQKVQVKCHFINAIETVELIDINSKGVLLKPGDGNCTCKLTDACKTGAGRCNCDKDEVDWIKEESHVWLEDSGYFDDDSILPFKEIAFNWKKRASYFVWGFYDMGVGPLECIEQPDLLPADEFQWYRCRNLAYINSSLECLLDINEFGDPIGCRDLSNLQYCSTFECPDDYTKCPDAYCIHNRLLCDGNKHCPDGEDEVLCDNNASCPGEFRCKGSNVCIPQNLLCDGKDHCNRKDDEIMCSLHCPFGCVCDMLAFTCQEDFSLDITTLSTKARHLDISGQPFYHHKDVISNLVRLVVLKLSDCQIEILYENIFSQNKDLTMMDLSYNKIRTIRSNAFNGLSRLKTVILIGNAISNIEDNAFFGLIAIQSLDIVNSLLGFLSAETFNGLLNIQHLNISSNNLKQIQAGSFKSLTNLKTLDVRNNYIPIQENIFDGLTSLEWLYTDTYSLCCLRPNSVSEENCFPEQDEFSSCEDLMRSDALRSFLWIFGVSALLGNAFVLIFKIVFDRESLKKSYELIIANLALSDLLMGFYMLIIASADIAFRGRYIWNDIFWRESWMCRFAGVLATISSEASVVFILLITIERFLIIKWPFGEIRVSRKLAITLCILAWVFSLIIALVPFVPILYFDEEFYSRSSVCLAIPLTRQRPAGWEYSVGIFIVLNFVLFCVIGIGQLMIYIEYKVWKKKFSTKQQKQSVELAKSLVIVATTDFLCWFPIGIMGLLALSDHPISGEVYAWVIVFVMPINSVVNPVLYTLSPMIKEKIATKVKATGKAHQFSVKSSRKGTNLFEIKLGKCDKEYGTITLKEQLDTRSTSIMSIFRVLVDILEIIKLLHDRDLPYGSLQCETIKILQINDSVISGGALMYKDDKKYEEADPTDDIYDFGMVVRAVLRQTLKKKPKLM